MTHRAKFSGLSLTDADAAVVNPPARPQSWPAAMRRLRLRGGCTRETSNTLLPVIAEPRYLRRCPAGETV